MVINKIILKEHKTKRTQYSVSRIYWLWCWLSFRESSTTIEFVPVITLGGDSIISKVKNLNSVAVAINLGAR